MSSENWKWRKELEFLPQEGAKRAMVLSSDHEICAVLDSTLNPRTASDYARLFANAPKLLAACKLLFKQISEGELQAFEDSEDKDFVSALDVLLDIMEVAEGKPSE